MIPGVVLAGSLDGYLRAYDAQTGKILWQYDTNQDVTGVNGAAGRGGSVNGAGATVSGGLVFQTTGYAAYGLGIPGNALLVFGVPSKDGSAAAPSTRN
jgi:polyvinyl alcohol dehydrogenase (cytochrome)